MRSHLIARVVNRTPRRFEAVGEVTRRCRPRKSQSTALDGRMMLATAAKDSERASDELEGLFESKSDQPETFISPFQTHLGSACPFAVASELAEVSHGHHTSASVVRAVSIELEKVLVEAWKLKKEVREQNSC